jgi:hypothetical protein
MSIDGRQMGQRENAQQGHQGFTDFHRLSSTSLREEQVLPG